MRRLGVFLLAVTALLFLLRRRRHDRRDSVSLYYGDGSMVTLEPHTPGFERIAALARQAL